MTTDTALIHEPSKRFGSTHSLETELRRANASYQRAMNLQPGYEQKLAFRACADHAARAAFMLRKMNF